MKKADIGYAVKKTGKILCRNRPNYFEWKFGDFTSVLQMRGCIQSPSFSFVGAAWCLKFYTSAEFWDFVFTAASLTRESARNPENRIYGRIGIKRDDGTVYVSHTFDQRTFNDTDSSISFNYFVKRSTLSADVSEIAPRDEVTFFCWMSTIDDGCKQMETQTEPVGRDVSTQTLGEDFQKAGIVLDSVQVTPSNSSALYEEFKVLGRGGCEEVQCASAKGTNKLSEDVKDLFLNGKNYDTTIKVANREFQAHRLILGARSPVFASMYSHDTTERRTGIVEIEDSTPEVFQDFLIFLYSGKLESLTFKNVFDLYAIADKYDVQEVKEECLKFMISNLSVEHFCNVMALALKYSESDLKKSATDFFVENSRKISVTPDWLCFHRAYPVESNELFIKAFERYAPK